MTPTTVEPTFLQQPGDFLFPVVLGLLGALFAAIAIRALIVGAASRHWPKVNGTVRSVRIEHMIRQHDPDYYGAKVSYEYLFNGRIYRNEEQVGQLTYERSMAVQDGAAYRRGDAVQVSVNPARPHQSTLRPGRDWRYLIVAILGLAALCGALWKLVS